MVLLHPPDCRTALAAVATAFSGSGGRWTASRPLATTRIYFRPLASRAADSPPSRRSPQPLPLDAAASVAVAVAAAREEKGKPEICTADELHYAPVPGTEWRLALWRYRPPPEAPARNHPLMLLSGVGTNAIGFDLSPGASFARHMSCQGFDTWIVEVRGAGLSSRVNGLDLVENKTNGTMTAAEQLIENSTPILNSEMTRINGEKTHSVDWNETELVTELTDSFMSLGERLSGYLNDSQLRDISAKFLDRISELLEDTRLSDRFNEIAEKISGLLQARRNSAIAGQIRDLSQRLINVIEEGQKTVSPQLFDFHDRLAETIEDFQKQLDMIITYDWDFDHYLEEDVPAAMEYIRVQTDVKDGKLLAIGHSMGGILLYSMISKCAHSGVKAGLAAVVTLASSVDYTSSNSSLKLLLPLANPAEALNVPAVPLGALLAAAHPLSSRPPYVLSWLNDQISAQDMMHPELFSKLVLNNFCTVPAKVLLQLTTAFREGGLRNRSGTFSYKNHLRKCDVPVLALAGDRDLICPPEAVYETVKLIPKEMVTYKVLGRHGGPHYAHYDLVGGRLAVDEVYPCIIEFLSRHDGAVSPSDKEDC